MPKTIQKDPADNRFYDMDWSLPMTRDGDTLASAVWEVPDGLTKIGDGSVEGNRAFVRLAGGTVNETYPCECTILSTNGSTMQDTLYMEVVDR